jgi:RimJ/RimL family protein N-acetyltransferase
VKGVELLELDHEIIERVVQVAVNDAAPGDVMPTTPAQSWTLGTQKAYNDILSQRVDQAPDEWTWVILVRGDVAGLLRLQRRGDGAHEVFTWLGRSWRRQGVARAALGMLREMARELNVRRFVVESKDNRAALAMLREHEAIVLPREAD